MITPAGLIIDAWVQGVLLAMAIMIIALIVVLATRPRWSARGRMGPGGDETTVPTAGSTIGAPAPPPVSTATSAPIARTVRVADRDRQYFLHLPPRPADPPVPLLVMLHGGFGSAEGFGRVTSITEPALARGYLVAYPQGYGRSWNAGDCCGPAMREGLDDVGFLRLLIADAADVAAMPVEVYPVGFSNGAAMAYRLGCEMADQIAGLVAVGSAMRTPTEGCHPARPVPVLHIHGELDRFAPIAGGVGIREQAGAHPPLAATIAFWTEHNQRGAAPDVGSGELAAPRPGGQRAPVVQVLVPELGHQWPGGANLPGDVFGPWTEEPSANRLTLDFVDDCRRTRSDQRGGRT